MSRDQVRITGLICNGRHVGTTNWEGIMWGKPPLLGQLPKLVQVFLHERKYAHIAKIIFGTGASQKDGMYEAEYMAVYLFENLHRLAEFPQLSAIDFARVDKLKTDLQAIICLDTDSKNTREEVTNALKNFACSGVTRVVCVTCPTHAPRCARDMNAAKEETRNLFPDGFWVTSSDIPFVGTKADDVVIIEPPHRGDTPPSFRAFHSHITKITKAFFMLSEDKRRGLLEDLGKVRTNLQS